MTKEPPVTGVGTVIILHIIADLFIQIDQHCKQSCSTIEIQIDIHRFSVCLREYSYNRVRGY